MKLIGGGSVRHRWLFAFLVASFERKVGATRSRRTLDRPSGSTLNVSAGNAPDHVHSGVRCPRRAPSVLRSAVRSNREPCRSVALHASPCHSSPMRLLLAISPKGFERQYGFKVLHILIDRRRRKKPLIALVAHEATATRRHACEMACVGHWRVGSRGHHWPSAVRSL